MVIDVKEWLSLDKCMNKVDYQTFQKMGVLEMCECIHTNIHQLVYLTFVQVTASFILCGKVGNSLTVPQDVHNPITGTCKYITLLGKGN